MQTIEDIQAQIPPLKTFRRAPTDQWYPEHCGDIDIKIDASGHWFHEGTLIRRAGLVRLLASVLVFEAGEYWLKTPVEKMRIQVEDAPFVVLELDHPDGRTEQIAGLGARTNIGEAVTLYEPWHLEPTPEGELLPLIAVTETLTARLSRNLYYHLCHEAMAQGEPPKSGQTLFWQAVGQRWPLGRT